VPSELLTATLAALATAESALLGRAGAPRRFRRDGATLWDPADPADPAAFADRAIRDALTTDDPGADAADEDLELDLASSIVRLGKLSSPDRLKVRSYLVVDGELRSLKVWAGEVAVATGRREVDVRSRIAGIDGYRTPPILDHGEDGETAFLLEPVVRGQHPTSGAQRVAMAADLAEALAAGYGATSRGDEPLSAITHEELPSRIDAVLRDERLPWPDDDDGEAGAAGAAGDRDQVRRRVAKLIAKDRSLPVAITHNDLVASNVIRDDDGRHHLVDWEHGRRGSPAFDLLKLVLASGDDEAALAAITPHLEAFGGRGLRRYRTAHQLALGVAQTLSWAPAARERAARAGRADRFDAEHLQRVRWLTRWLDG
jgi:hypothetical protein